MGFPPRACWPGITVLTHAVAPLFQNVNGTPGRVHVCQGAGFLEHRSVTEKSVHLCATGRQVLAHGSSSPIPGHRPFSLCGVRLARAGLAGDEGEGLIGEAQGHCSRSVVGGTSGRLSFLGSRHRVQPHSVAPSTWMGMPPRHSPSSPLPTHSGGQAQPPPADIFWGMGGPVSVHQQVNEPAPE